MNLVLHTVKAVSIAGLAEGMALADRAGISPKDVIDILGMTSLKCPLLLEKGKGINSNMILFRLLFDCIFYINIILFN